MHIRQFVVAALTVCAAPLLQAQGSAGAIRLALEPGSQLSLEGTSTLHGFTCTTEKLEAYIDVDPSYKTADPASLTKPVVNVQVRIPVKSLTCGNKKLESNMPSVMTYEAEKPQSLLDEDKVIGALQLPISKVTITPVEDIFAK